MPNFNDLGFAITNIKVAQFATTDEAYRKTGELEIQTDAAFGVAKDKKTIVVKMRFRFYKKESPFITLETGCYFEINPKGWKQLIKEDESIQIPKNLISHLTVLTVGTTRGILHSKTEGTKYNKYILPTINVNELIEDEDIIFTSADLQNAI